MTPTDALIQWLKGEISKVEEAILDGEPGAETYLKLKHERRILIEVTRKAEALHRSGFLVEKVE